MGAHKNIRRLIALGGLGALVAFMSIPAVAYAAGNKDRSGHTEDSDTNDGGTPNNVSDSGDNKHPSGKDRSVEHGGSGTQGNSGSDPDDDGKGPDRSNGGPDKANGSGGVDKADQDGNNGCGNDDDFEDDNEGWCGKPPKNDHVKKDKRCEDRMKDHGKGKGRKSCNKDDDVIGTTDKPDDESEVAADKDVEDDTGTVKDTTDDPDVLGEFVKGGRDQDEVAAAGAERDDVLGKLLPFTGVALWAFVAVALGLLVTGAVLLNTRRKRI